MSRQTEIPGTEQPKNPDIENAIDAWLEAKDEQKYATERTKLRHAGLLVVMQNVGVEAYPFVDPKTGKKKQIVIARDPKAKATKAPRWSRRDDDEEDDIGEEVTVTDLNDDQPAVDNVVELRTVRRESVEDEIDPFAATRRAMDDDTETVEGSYVPPAEEAPKKRKGRRAK
jgi:hypothetical protein